MRLWIQELRHSGEETPRVDTDVLQANGVELVGSQEEAEVGLMWHIFETRGRDPRLRNFSPDPLPLNRIIMCYDEPPLSYHEKYYDLRDSYLAWLPLPSLAGGIPLTLDPVVFPYPPYTQYDGVREETTLRGQGIFYRGSRRESSPGGSKFGRTDLSTTRVRLVEDLLARGVQLDLKGPGWPGEHTYMNQGDVGGGRWPSLKRHEARITTADFHLCIENSRMENYVTEKIHHGFNSDLVVLYLGNADIRKWVPNEAFIDLSSYYDASTGQVDADDVIARIRNLEQSEYDDIVHAAREWRRGDLLEERHEDARQRLTRLILETLPRVTQ